MKHMKKIILLILACIVFLPAFSQKKFLNYTPNGQFKIIQFTDVHYQPANPESAVAIELIKEVLDDEEPDFVVFTGDVVWERPATQALDEVLAPVIKKKIPWAMVFGNHDDEYDMSRSQIMDYITQKPYCMAQAGDKNLKGVGNYILEVRNSTDEKVKSVLYFMDSGSYSRMEGVGGYDWLDFTQVDWYQKESAAYSEENGGTPCPSLAFFHIPLAEYPLMKADTTCIMIGNKDETECNGKLNTGMFAAMRQSGDIMGTFVGHDHNNDYIGMYYNIALAYGRYSGGNTVYNDLGLNGCRVIEMTEDARTFKTYIRLRGGEKLFEVTYPETLTPVKEPQAN